jgi:hypothetical protein
MQSTLHHQESTCRIPRDAPNHYCEQDDIL